MIKSLLETKYYKSGVPIEKYAFLCQNESDFDRLVEICENENIIFSKGSYKEPTDVLYNTYRKYFTVPAYALICLVDGEIQFYARLASEFKKDDNTKYYDWDSYIFFDFRPNILSRFIVLFKICIFVEIKNNVKDTRAIRDYSKAYSNAYQSH